MRIFVDADACPVPAKEVVFRASTRWNLPVLLVANQRMSFPSLPNISLEVVAQGADVADDRIVHLVQPGDLVITADIPLASRVIKKNATVIDPRGELLTEGNIGPRLALRDLMDSLRTEGLVGGGPPPYGSKEKQSFANQLDKFLTRVLKK